MLRACLACWPASSSGAAMPSEVACSRAGREFTEPRMPGCCPSAQCPSGGLIGLPTTLHRLASSMGTELGWPTCAVLRSPAQDKS